MVKHLFKSLRNITFMTNSLFASTCEKTTEAKLRDFAKKNSISRIVFLRHGAIVAFLS